MTAPAEAVGLGLEGQFLHGKDIQGGVLIAAAPGRVGDQVRTCRPASMQGLAGRFQDPDDHVLAVV